MKLSEMNAHERLAAQFVWKVMSEYIGGYENMMEDQEEGSEGYEDAKAFLSQGHDELAKFVYDEVMKWSDREMDKHMRFAGKKFIMERIERRLEKWGY